MADFIRRSDVIGLLEDMLLFGEYDIIASSFSKADEEKAYRAINDIPAVNRWISCSESLPDKSGTYLVWFEYYRYGDYDGLHATHGIGSFHQGRWAFINHETGWQSLRVIAWMPLPEPPKE